MIQTGEFSQIKEAAAFEIVLSDCKMTSLYTQKWRKMAMVKRFMVVQSR